MTRSASTLAALADAAVPGLRPRLVEELLDHVGERFHVGFVQDSEDRRWVVRIPADAVAAAQLEESAALATLLEGRLPFDVPQSAGVAGLRDGRRAVVYRLIPGRCVSFALLPGGPGLTVTIAQAIAAVHNVDRGLFEEAGVPAYEADDLRRRRQADLDRGAATGLVPNGLLSRWERMLDDVAWWRFAPTPVHGRLEDDHVLLRFDDPGDCGSGRVVGMTGWEHAQIGDPAEDLAALLAQASPDARAAALSAYAQARTEPPDPHLADRAGLLAELECLNELLTARRLGDRRHLTQATEALRRLDDVVSHGRGSGNRSGTPIDQVPVDFTPTPAGEDLYHAGTPAASITVEQADPPAAHVDRPAARDDRLEPGDTGSVDTGSVDAGTVDAGSADARSVDARSVEARSVEADEGTAAGREPLGRGDGPVVDVAPTAPSLDVSASQVSHDALQEAAALGEPGSSRAAPQETRGTGPDAPTREADADEPSTRESTATWGPESHAGGARVPTGGTDRPDGTDGTDSVRGTDDAGRWASPPSERVVDDRADGGSADDRTTDERSAPHRAADARKSPRRTADDRSADERADDRSADNRSADRATDSARSIHSVDQPADPSDARQPRRGAAAGKRSLSADERQARRRAPDASDPADVADRAPASDDSDTTDDSRATDDSRRTDRSRGTDDSRGTDSSGTGASPETGLPPRAT